MATVLICDDELMNRKVASKILKKEGFDVLEAIHGQNALDILSKHRVELILMDLMMPIMDGYEAIKAIKKDDEISHIPIIILSALSEKKVIIKGLDLGAIEYLTKPFDIVDFKIRVTNGVQIGEYQYSLKSEIDKKTKEQIELQELHKELDDLYHYNTQQQIVAKEKIGLSIVNDDKINSRIIFHATDILSGDFYSIHKVQNDAILVYVIDGQGHGVSPALSVFAISATISNILEQKDISFEEIVKKLFPRIQNFLGEIEQLSYTMLYISQKDIKYICGGMYPFMIKDKDENITRYKANNLPFMNFSNIPEIETIDIQNYNSILIYTDGVVEDLEKDMSEFSPKNILQNPETFYKIRDKIQNEKFEDDITVVYLKINFDK